ncbi:MAG: hypothetical protein NTZ05_18665, partial [Chloroflexi bacterium]|nr:hypothetical protein [Chloroflexota bacterium]
LSLLAAAQAPVPVEELLAAFLRQAKGAYAEPRSLLVRAGKELAVLWRSDPQRLATVLARVQQ